MTRPTLPLGHEALLTLARKVRAAADDTDAHRLEEAARLFALALERHLRAEAVPLSQMVPAQARILRRGQHRIGALAAALVADATGGCSAPHRECRSRADELVALLSLQARDEHLALGRPAA